VDSGKIVVEQELGDRVEMAELHYPCLLTVEKDILQPRLPSYKLKLETKDRLVQVLTLADLSDPDETKYGLNGSATQVERIFPPETNRQRNVWEGTPTELAEKCFEAMQKSNVF
jgi:electron transfer flavoprotein beta subunit